MIYEKREWFWFDFNKKKTGYIPGEGSHKENSGKHVVWIRNDENNFSLVVNWKDLIIGMRKTNWIFIECFPIKIHKACKAVNFN